MADASSILGDEPAIEFMTASLLVYGAIAAACSSPQTTELNAAKRSDTLIKWVNIGILQAGLLVGVAATIAKHPKAVLAGGTITAAIMYASYMHAKSAGLKNAGAPTESY